MDVFLNGDNANILVPVAKVLVWRHHRSSDAFSTKEEAKLAVRSFRGELQVCIVHAENEDKWHIIGSPPCCPTTREHVLPEFKCGERMQATFMLAYTAGFKCRSRFFRVQFIDEDSFWQFCNVFGVDDASLKEMKAHRRIVVKKRKYQGYDGEPLQKDSRKERAVFASSEAGKENAPCTMKQVVDKKPCGHLPIDSGKENNGNVSRVYFKHKPLRKTILSERKNGVTATLSNGRDPEVTKEEDSSDDDCDYDPLYGFDSQPFGSAPHGVFN